MSNSHTTNTPETDAHDRAILAASEEARAVKHGCLELARVLERQRDNARRQIAALVESETGTPSKEAVRDMENSLAAGDALLGVATPNLTEVRLTRMLETVCEQYQKVRDSDPAFDGIKSACITDANALLTELRADQRQDERG